MLQNGGMELGTWTHATHTGQEFDNIYVPTGWVAFWKEGLPVPHDPQNPDGYGRPEMQVIRLEEPYLAPPRIHSGQWGFKFFTFYRIHDAGIYQQVAVTPGATYRAMAWAHAWSSDLDDASHSDLASASDRANFTFSVGLDPTGGTDPWGATVVWGAGAHLYDQFGQIPAVTVQAQAGTLTVFVRSQVLWAFKHCDAYIDDATLEVVAAPPPPDCPGQPRIDYVRRYNDIPQTATLERATEIFRYCWEHGKQTVGASADDAGIGALTDKTAIEWDRPAAEHAAYRAFYAEHYPGTRVEFAGESAGEVLPPIVPPAGVRPPETNGATTLHWTPTTAEGVDRFLQTIHPPAVQVVTAGGGGPQLAQARAWSPRSLLVYRRVENGLDVYNPSDAQPFVQRYIADLAPHFDLADFSQPPLYLVSINEKYECRHATQNAACATWDRAFMHAVEATGLNLRAVVYTAPVGNPEPDATDLTPLLDMVAMACAGGHLLGKHCYYASVPAQPNFYQESWQWYGGRFALDDDFFTSRGLFPFWFLAEGGACGAEILYPRTAQISAAIAAPVPRWRNWPQRARRIRRGADGQLLALEPLPEGARVTAAELDADPVVVLNSGAGWKYAGSIERYAAELAWCDAWYMDWNATHGGRLLAVSLFTSGGWGWDSYNLVGGDLDAVTAVLA